MDITMKYFQECQWVWISILLLLVVYPSTSAELNINVRRACQNTHLHLDCEKGEVIVISRSVFGRTQFYIPECGFQSVKSCSGKDTVHIVSGMCHGKQSCVIYVTTATFGNPCVGIYKYLEVGYMCALETDIYSICSFSNLSLLKARSVIMTTQNYPRFFGKNLSCSLNVSIADGLELKLETLHAKFPRKNSCHQASLEIEDHGGIYEICSDVEEISNLFDADFTVTFRTNEMEAFYPTGGYVIAKGLVMKLTAFGCPFDEIDLPEHGKLGNLTKGISADIMCNEGYKFMNATIETCHCKGNAWQCPILKCQKIVEPIYNQSISSTPGQIAFSVNMSPRNISIMPNHPVPFNVITLNDGFVFNPKTHIFEVPISGVFLLTWSINGAIDNCRIIIKNGREVIAGGYVRGNDIEMQRIMEIDNGNQLGTASQNSMEDSEINRGISLGLHSVSGTSINKLEIGSMVWVEIAFANIRNGKEALSFENVDHDISPIVFSGHIIYATG